MRARLGVGAAGLLLGFAIGLVIGRSPSRREDPSRPRTPARTTAAESHPSVIVVGEKRPSDVRDGTLLLAPNGPPRRLLYEGEDVDPALDALERFLAALLPGRVERKAPGRARVGRIDLEWHAVDLFWRVDGEGGKRTLRIVALPADPYDWDDAATDVTEAIARWTILHNVFPTFRHDDEATTRVRVPNAPYGKGIGDAATEVFKERGLDLAQEEVAASCACLLARGPGGEILWSFHWTEDQQDGSWAVRHHADPFDTAGEHETLLAIFRRATGLEPAISLEVLR
jgi:hypothetical protein